MAKFSYKTSEAQQNPGALFYCMYINSMVPFGKQRGAQPTFIHRPNSLQSYQLQNPMQFPVEHHFYTPPLIELVVKSFC